MEENKSHSLNHTLELEHQQHWTYETDEFHGICEIAGDEMVVKVRFQSPTSTRVFYDVLGIDGVIRWRLLKPVSVERLAEQLASDFSDLSVEVSGRAKTHGWITSKVTRRWNR